MESVAQALVGNLGLLVGEEFQQLRGVGSEVAQLRDELATMNAVLRIQSEADDSAVDYFVREWMKQVRELAYDAEDCVDLYAFRIRCLLSDAFLVRCKRVLATLSLRRRLFGDIKVLRARAVAISERHARYGVSRVALPRSPHLAPVSAAAASAQALRPANDPDQFVGMRDQASTLAERVKAVKKGCGDEGKLEVFSIVGFGGLGKTTLAMEVCRQLKTEFQRQAQVSVSQAFDGRKDVKGLLKRVLQQIMKPKAENGLQQIMKPKAENEKEQDTADDIDKMDLETLAKRLEEHLKEKRYLIVIDDVWTVAAWDAIRSKMPDNNHDSRIVVTTRIETVAIACTDASEISGDNIYQIKPLNSEDSKKLFLSRAFGSKDASCPKELEAEMDKILKKCGGLPLAIVSIGSLLESYKSPEHKDMWDRVCKSIGYHMESSPTLKGMRQILTLSYDHLPYHLKGCMMYLSIFPANYVINKDRLLYRWIAEGLVEERRGMTLMDVAESYYDELVTRSMINPAGEIISQVYGSVDTCRVHDMMLEVMVSKSLESNFVSLVREQYKGMSYDRIRRLSIHGGGQRPKDSPSKKMGMRDGMEEINVQHVRSLSMFQLEGNKLLDRLDEFTLLRVLDLEDCKGLQNKHMGDICRMYLLRYLSLRSTDISVLPPKVRELEHLQTLDVRATCLCVLPETITNLEKLERLFFSQKDVWSTMWKPPQGLHKMKALREVGWVVLEDDVQVAQEVGELEHLQRLSIYVNCNGSNGKKVLEEFARSLSKTYSLRSLDMGNIGWDKALNFLLELPSPPRLLRFLRIAGFIDKLPNWVESLTYLVEFHMSWASLVDDQLFGVLCKLPNLKSIWMQPNCYTGIELVARSAFKFPALKNLRGTCDQEMPKVYKFEEGSMTKLEKLSLNFDNWWEKSIVGIEHLTNLREVQLTGKRDNPALDFALEQLKAESEKHPSKFTVGVKYD